MAIQFHPRHKQIRCCDFTTFAVLSELKKLSWTNEHDNRKTKLFQRLTPDIGHPKVKEHLAGVTTAMQFAKIQGLSWEHFLAMFDKTAFEIQGDAVIRSLGREGTDHQVLVCLAGNPTGCAICGN